MGTGTAVNTGDTVTAAKMNLKLETIVNADVEVGAAIAESKLSLNNATHANTNDPTADQKAALAGSSGTPSVTNKYVTNADARNSDSRAPTSHSHTTHTDIGTNTHVQIDTHISSTSNPHSVTAAQAGAEATGTVSTHASLTTGIHGAGAGILVPSIPPGSMKKVTNIYYDPSDGQIKYEVEP